MSIFDIKTERKHQLKLASAVEHQRSNNPHPLYCQPISQISHEYIFTQKSIAFSMFLLPATQQHCTHIHQMSKTITIV